MNTVDLEQAIAESWTNDQRSLRSQWCKRVFTTAIRLVTLEFGTVVLACECFEVTTRANLWLALLVTCVVCVTATVFAKFTSIDFTTTTNELPRAKRLWLCSLSNVLLLSVACAVSPWPLDQPCTALVIDCSLIAAHFFGLTYLVTAQLIIGGRTLQFPAHGYWLVGSALSILITVLYLKVFIVVVYSRQVRCTVWHKLALLLESTNQH